MAEVKETHKCVTCGKEVEQSPDEVIDALCHKSAVGTYPITKVHHMLDVGAYNKETMFVAYGNCYCWNCIARMLWLKCTCCGTLISAKTHVNKCPQCSSRLLALCYVCQAPVTLNLHNKRLIKGLEQYVCDAHKTPLIRHSVASKQLKRQLNATLKQHNKSVPRMEWTSKNPLPVKKAAEQPFHYTLITFKAPATMFVGFGWMQQEHETIYVSPDFYSPEHTEILGIPIKKSVTAGANTIKIPGKWLEALGPQSNERRLLVGQVLTEILCRNAADGTRLETRTIEYRPQAVTDEAHRIMEQHIENWRTTRGFNNVI